jgi:hypothetical protein
MAGSVQNLIGVLVAAAGLLGFGRVAATQSDDYSPTVTRVVRLLPRPPGEIKVVNADAIARSSPGRVRHVDGFVIHGQRIIYLARQSQTLQRAMRDGGIFDYALAIIIWHEMAHIEGADEPNAQRQDEALWLEYVRDGRVDAVRWVSRIFVEMEQSPKSDPSTPVRPIGSADVESAQYAASSRDADGLCNSVDRCETGPVPGTEGGSAGPRCEQATAPHRGPAGARLRGAVARRRQTTCVPEHPAGVGRGVQIGFVYILTNASMPGLIKVGMTRGNPEERAIQLSAATAAPKPFDVFAALPVGNPRAAEAQAHGVLDEYRVNGRREFFRLAPEDAVKLLERALTGHTDFKALAVKRRQERFDNATRTMERNRIYSVAKRKRPQGDEFLTKLMRQFDQKNRWGK